VQKHAATVNNIMARPPHPDPLPEGRGDLCIRVAICATLLSGDLEPGMPEAYAHAINCEALLDTVRVMGHHLATGSTIIYVTSHEAHFHGSGESYPRYVRIAASKKAGEIALLAYAAVLSDSGVKLNTTKLLEHWDPGYTARRAPQSVNSRPLRMWPKKS